MDRWRLILAFVILFSLGSSVGHARKCLIFGHGGVPLRGLFTVKILESHEEPAHGTVLSTENERLPTFLRYFHDGRRPATMFQMPRPKLQRLHAFSSKGISQSFICDTCLDISTFAEQVLTDPETTNNVLEYINGSFCEVLPGLKEKCSGLAATYVPEMVEVLQTYLAPDKLCSDTNLCTSSSMLLLGDVQTCSMCTDFATKALTYLKDNQTEVEVLDNLHSECSKLGPFSAKCDLLVDAYAPIYIEKVDSMTPEQVCQKVGLCTALSLRGTSHCAACELAVFEMKAKLRKPEMQEKMLEVLLDGCSKVPNHVDECKEIITQYGPFILANIDTFVDADTVCTKIHACEATPASIITPAVIEKSSIDTTESLIQLPITHQGTASQ